MSAQVIAGLKCTTKKKGNEKIKENEKTSKLFALANRKNLKEEGRGRTRCNRKLESRSGRDRDPS